MKSYIMSLIKSVEECQSEFKSNRSMLYDHDVVEYYLQV